MTVSSNNRGRQRALKKLNEVYPKGIQELTAELQSRGFAVRVLREKTDVKWSELNLPRSADSKSVEPSSFCYLKKNLKNLHYNFNLVFIEDSQVNLDDLAHPSIVLGVKNVEAAFDFVLARLSYQEWSGANCAHLYPHVQKEEGVVIGPDCEIGDSCVLEAGVRIGAGVKIGSHTRIGAHSRIADGVSIGSHCVFTSHVSIGGVGFGFVKYPGDEHPKQRVHVGRVVIGDYVRLGAFVSVDRGVLEDTMIGSHTSIDNHVQVAHNCIVGEANVYCSFVGLSGSTVVGKRVTMAGMVGTKGHVEIGDDVTVAAQSGISRNIASGQTVKGYPPRPLTETLKIEALVGKLPELYERLKKLEK